MAQKSSGAGHAASAVQRLALNITVMGVSMLAKAFEPSSPDLPSTSTHTSRTLRKHKSTPYLVDTLSVPFRSVGSSSLLPPTAAAPKDLS
ncbi:hypothetical protein DXG01_008818, partial [Tephrocybe rancida]